MSSMNDSSQSFPHTNDQNTTKDYCNKETPVQLNKYKALPPISKIPGLNPDSDVIASAEQKLFRTFKVLETDSSYVKLAKQGGRKNLLQYKEFKDVETGTRDINDNNKNNVSMSRKPCLVDDEELKKDPPRETSETNVVLDCNNNDNTMDDCNNNILNNNNNNNSSKIHNRPGKSIMEIKKQSKKLKSMKHLASKQDSNDAKERRDILPVDNVEILHHLNAPKKALPKLKNQPKVTPRSVRIGGR